MIVRVGIPKSTGAIPGMVERIEAPALLSAMSLWDRKRKRFRRPGSAICDLDCALDSAGFVAMSQLGGYPWTVQQYVELAGLHSWAWWASMDLCCEPEIATDADEVTRRVEETAQLLALCTMQARVWRDAGATWLTDPMPVLQGWRPVDYQRSADLTAAVLGELPALVGIGSVCRRHLGGPDGLVAVLSRLHRVLPPHVGFHLFGVKGPALAALAGHPRVVSTDSQAWGTAARREALAAGTPCTLAMKQAALLSWLERQTLESPPAQQRLF